MILSRRDATIVLTAFICGLSSCTRDDISREDARRISDAFVRKHFGMDPAASHVLVEDRSSFWRFVYSPKKESFGGVETVDVDKNTGKIVGTGGTQ
jgi:hypothetical protein